MDYLVAVLLPQLLHGLVFGAALGLLALGLTVIFGLLGVMNFAHGDCVARHPCPSWLRVYYQPAEVVLERGWKKAFERTILQEISRFCICSRVVV